MMNVKRVDTEAVFENESDSEREDKYEKRLEKGVGKIREKNEKSAGKSED